MKKLLIILLFITTQISAQEIKKLVVSSGNGSVGSNTPAIWGGITGNLVDQTDLNTALFLKQNQLSGTGFVKAIGNTISYDNTSYQIAGSYATTSALTSKLNIGDTANMLANYKYWLAGYVTRTQADNLYSLIGHTHTFASLTNKPTTLAGYGITDGVGSSTIASKIDIANYVISERPSGTIDGTNTIFTLLTSPISGKEILYLNGIRQERIRDYTISGNTITFLIAPKIVNGKLDELLADYLK